jgi:predicted membrane-bound spermidine synthase
VCFHRLTGIVVNHSADALDTSTAGETSLRSVSVVVSLFVDKIGCGSVLVRGDVEGDLYPRSR